MSVVVHPYKGAAAHHEAGHAVVQLSYDSKERFRFVAIFRRPGCQYGEWDGVVEPLGGLETFRAKKVARALARMDGDELAEAATGASIISLAGPIAEGHFLKETSACPLPTFAAVVEGDVAEATEFVQMALKLGAIEAREFVLNCHGRANAVVTRHWPAIAEVAAELIVHHRLSYAKCLAAASRGGLDGAAPAAELCRAWLPAETLDRGN